jgi:hypothetical protein
MHEAIRAGIRKLGAAARERRISSAYARTYVQTPLTDEEEQMLDSAVALAAELPQ